MKRQSVFMMLLASTCLCIAPFSANAQKIMPMGDSVTARGSSPESSYRFWLYADMTNAGYQFTDVGGTLSFIGDQNGVSDGTPANSWDFEEYEGGGPGGDGWTTVNGINDAPNAAAEGPDIVLLDLGANDWDENNEPVKTNLLEVQQNLETIINTFYNANSSIVILLAVPTPWVIQDFPDPTEKQFMTGLGSAVKKAADDEKKLGVNVIVVNLAAGFNPSPNKGDTVDGTHPDVKGEQGIAKKYFNALRPVLKKMGVVPQKTKR